MNPEHSIFLLKYFESKIVGCDFRYNYKMNNTDLMTLKASNVDIFGCAVECLADNSCQYGWVHFSGNNEVISRNKNISRFYSFTAVLLC